MAVMLVVVIGAVVVVAVGPTGDGDEVEVVSSSDFNAATRFRISNLISLISAALAGVCGGADASLRIALSIPSRSTNRDSVTSFIVSSGSCGEVCC